MALMTTVRQKALGAYVISLSGSLDSQTYDLLEERLRPILAESPQLLVLDMAELDYLSSAGIRVILKTQKALKAVNGRLVFMNLQPQIKKVFEIINALPSMKVFRSLKEMDDYLDAMQKAVTQGGQTN
jgi:anti-sigma B factor antagonist